MNISTCFRVVRWSAWASNVETKADWASWVSGDLNIEGACKPKISFVPAMQRRRFSGLSRYFLHVTHECLSDEPVKDSHLCRVIDRELGSVDASLPDYSIFCSRYGELNRTLAIMDDVIAQEQPSPTGFSLSVHNTAAGLYSILFKTQAATTATASGVDTLETALIAAAARLHSGRSKRVLVVYADEELPENFVLSSRQVLKPSALALELSVNEGIPVHLTGRLNAESAEQYEQANLALVRCLINSDMFADQEFITAGERLAWHWRVKSRSLQHVRA